MIDTTSDTTPQQLRAENAESLTLASQINGLIAALNSMHSSHISAISRIHKDNIELKSNIVDMTIRIEKLTLENTILKACSKPTTTVENFTQYLQAINNVKENMKLSIEAYKKSSDDKNTLIDLAIAITKDAPVILTYMKLCDEDLCIKDKNTLITAQNEIFSVVNMGFSIMGLPSTLHVSPLSKISDDMFNDFCFESGE